VWPLLSASEHGQGSATAVPQFPYQQRTRENSARYPRLKAALRAQLTNVLHGLLNPADFSVQQKEYSRNKPQRQDSPSQIFQDASKATTPPVPGYHTAVLQQKNSTTIEGSFSAAASITANVDISERPIHSKVL